MELKVGYKQTDVGVIPEDWAAVPLGNLCAFKTGPFGSALHKSDYTSGGIPLVNPMHILDGKIVPSDDMTITVQAARNLSEFLLRRGDIVIGRRGDMGRCAVVLAAEDGWLCGTGSMIVRTGAASEPAFFQRVLSSPSAIGRITETSVGSTMVNLNQGTLRGLVVQAPPVEEQRAIAAALSDADALIASLDALINKKRDLKQAAIRQLLTGKTRLTGFTGEWDVKPIGPEIDLLTGHPFQSTGYSSIGVRLLRGSNVKRGKTDWSHEILQYWPEITSELARYELAEGDLVIAMDGSLVGKSYARLTSIDLPAMLLQRVARIRSKKIDTGYLAQFVGSDDFIGYCDSVKTVTAIPHISPQDIRNYRIPIPPTIAEQIAIATVLSDMDAEIATLEAQRDKADGLKQGMMQELLTGRIRLV